VMECGAPAEIVNRVTFDGKHLPIEFQSDYVIGVVKAWNLTAKLLSAFAQMGAGKAKRWKANRQLLRKRLLAISLALCVHVIVTLMLSPSCACISAHSIALAFTLAAEILCYRAMASLAKPSYAHVRHLFNSFECKRMMGQELCYADLLTSMNL
jgi:hypothetical protein